MTKFEELENMKAVVDYHYSKFKKEGSFETEVAWNRALSQLENMLEDSYSSLTEEEQEIVNNWF